MDDLPTFCCQHAACADHGKRGHGNLTVTATYGPRRTRLLRCRTCHARFSERKGTPLFNAKLPPAQAAAVLAHLADGTGVRQTGRLVGVGKDTVTRYARAAGGHARQLHDELVALSPQTTRVQVDEKWAFVAQKQRRAAGAPRRGDAWDFVALDPATRLTLSVVVGKRTATQAVALLRDVRRRLGGRTPALVASDEYRAYADALAAVFGDPAAAPGLCHAVVHKTRRRGRVVAVTPRIRRGTLPAGATVNTAYLERQHATDRHRNARKARKTYRFSKVWAVHVAMTDFTLYAANFCWPVRTLRQPGPAGRWQPRTPAMAAGLTDHVWSLQEWTRFPGVQR